MRTLFRGSGVCLLAIGGACQVGAGPAGPGLLGLLLLSLTDPLTSSGQDRLRRVFAPLPAAVAGFLACCALAWGLADWTTAGLREVVQFAVLLGLGVRVGRGLTRSEQQLLLSVVSVLLVANLIVAVCQLAFPFSASRALAAVYGLPASAGGTGPALHEELATGLFPSHFLYAVFVVVALPFALVRLLAVSKWALWVGEMQG